MNVFEIRNAERTVTALERIAKEMKALNESFGRMEAMFAKALATEDKGTEAFA